MDQNVNRVQCSQLVEYVIRPVLQNLALYRPWLNSEAAENLLLWTALVESNLTYIHQIRGPAIGLWQMEPATYNDIWRWLQGREALIGLLPYINPDPEELHWNLKHACAFARLKYAMVPAPLPDSKDIVGMAEYWGRYYNTLNKDEDKKRFIALASQTLN